MKRSEINAAYREASACFARHGWALPPGPKWDITDFGLGDFERFGLVLVNLADEPEYCEKLMYARPGQVTPMHAHRQKKEDIICRHGRLSIEVWPSLPDESVRGAPFEIERNGILSHAHTGHPILLEAGERVTLVPGLYHSFVPVSEDCVIGEVSTANDDANDNFFTDPAVGRFPEIEEDEPPLVRLVRDR